MNDVLTVCGVAIVTAAFTLILKQYKPEYAFGVVVASGIFLLLYMVYFFEDIFGYIEKIFSLSGIDKEKYKILLRCFGICVITKIASETCMDCGQSSISSKIDMVGKILILVSAMPLFSEIIEIIKILIEL